jgi:hypothetical protein
MPRLRVSIIALWAVVIAVSFCLPALADFFYYRDADGHLHITNVWERIPSGYRAQAARSRRAEGSPAPKTAQPTVVPQPQPPSIAMPAPAPARIEPSAVSALSSRPVDTRQFGLLRLRMSEHEVLRRLGPPVSIIENNRGTTAPGARVVRLTREQVWYYPGNGRTAATRLEFHNGLLALKSREYR